LFIRGLAGVVVVLVVGVEFDVFAYGKKAARIERGSAPFAVLTLVEGLRCDVWDEVIGADRKGPL